MEGWISASKSKFSFPRIVLDMEADVKLRIERANGMKRSVLDFNPINTIASHLSYWADEDVSHFMMSQLLSRPRSFAKGEKGAQK
jgi:hypothetical protein